MFSISKYTNWYYSIINQAKSQERIKSSDNYYESHHIIPKALGGRNLKNNIVLLTAREHFICHVLLVKMTTGKDKMRMSYAFYRFTSPKSRSHREKYTSAIYERHRRNFAQYVSGQNSYMYGVPKTIEQKRKIAKTREINGLNLSENNPMFGKHHTIEAIQKMSMVKKLNNSGQTSKFIAANPFKKPVTDGIEVFPSVRDCARKLQLHRRVIHRYISEGRLWYYRSPLIPFFSNQASASDATI